MVPDRTQNAKSPRIRKHVPGRYSSFGCVNNTKGYTVQKEETDRLHNLRVKKRGLEPVALGGRNGMDAHMECKEHATGAMSAEEGGWRYGEGDIDIDMDNILDEGYERREENFTQDELYGHTNDIREVGDRHGLALKSPTTPQQTIDPLHPASSWTISMSLLLFSKVSALA
jgi:hypothetical protein